MCCFEKQLCFVLFVAMGWDRRTEKVGKHLDKGAEGTVMPSFQQALCDILHYGTLYHCIIRYFMV